jgi:DNA invertase Pin-like site-specific DNA recombinase
MKTFKSNGSTQPAIGYARVSTDGQATEGVSLEAQRARIDEYCQSNGIELAETFSDEGLSGKRADNRPGLQSALKTACRRKGILVTYSLSRLGRSTRDLIDIAERIQQAGADLVSLTEQIDTTSAAGKMVFRMLAVLAEFERDLVSERTTAALAHHRASGRKTGGHVPFGYDVASDGRTLIENRKEQATIQAIIAKRKNGISYRTIADTLNGEGRATKNGMCWSPKTVRSVCVRNIPAESTG